ncbi:30S ribosomal protein S8 [Candidatus Saccharibacteria bacterium]|nr:30S ribosomal protein S8 [Candidatus Saccharibacteria bacterium]
MSIQSTDPIADLITRIRNAAAVGKHEVTVPSSKIKQAILKQLQKAKYIDNFTVESAKPRDILHITINKPGANSVITEITRMSKPGRRMYVSADDIPKVKQGRGMVLISTSKGVVSGQEAKKLRLGGEILVKVY